MRLVQSLKSKAVNLLNEQLISSSDEQLSKFNDVKLLPVASSRFNEPKFDKSKEPDKFLNDKSMPSTLPSSFQVMPVHVDGSSKFQLRIDKLEFWFANIERQAVSFLLYEIMLSFNKYTFLV